jgi:hypothetical protein
MQIHKFIKRDGAGAVLTEDRTGGNLPGGPAGWLYQKAVDIHPDDQARIGASSREILDGISTDGYFKWPDGGKLHA